uniref:Neuraminidase n=1 Tax=Wuhan asiatic toad influenza virus TaxID=2116482 RepID=A0A2P1GNT2_9ORTO|nr:NA [Wuhan asiatic toad influenza virus]
MKFHTTSNHVFVLHAASTSILFVIASVNLGLSIYGRVENKPRDFMQCNNSSSANNTEIYKEPVYLNQCPSNISDERQREPKYRMSRPTCRGQKWTVMSNVWTSRWVATGTNARNIRPPTAIFLKKGLRAVSLAHNTAGPNPLSGTGSDRSEFRDLITWSPSGYPGDESTETICKAWSFFACFDGKEDLIGCISGPDNNAVLTIMYGGKPTDLYNSYALDILRTMESQCVCNNGTCSAMITDGPDIGPSKARMLFIKEGKIEKVVIVDGPGSSMVEECSCINEDSNEFGCLCRDNTANSRRPFLKCFWDSRTCKADYTCSQTLLDCPRPNDSIQTCGTSFGSLAGGLKGAYIPLGKGRICATRTVDKIQRKGMELMCTNGNILLEQDAMKKIGDLVTPTAQTGYSSATTIPRATEECDTICVATELVFSGAKGTNADLVIHCLLGEARETESVVTAVVDRTTYSSLL